MERAVQYPRIPDAEIVLLLLQVTKLGH